jgi:hypothetical protein
MADGFAFRAKDKPVVIKGFNLFLELSKILYIATIILSIYLGVIFHVRFIVPLLLLHFVAKSIPYNLSAGLKWNYIGQGVFDTLIKTVTGANIYMWLVLQILAVIGSLAIIKYWI